MQTRSAHRHVGGDGGDTHARHRLYLVITARQNVTFLPACRQPAILMVRRQAKIASAVS